MLQRLTLVLAASAVVSSVAGATQDAGGSPNVLLILTDDTGIDMVGCYGWPDAAPTPNIDALAAGGAQFHAAFANPLCSPTRAQLLTGRHGYRTGVGTNIWPAFAFGLSTDETSLPALLRAHGYATAALGKWHLASVPTDGLGHPNLLGFDVFAGSLTNLRQRYDGPDDGTYYDWEIVQDGQTHDVHEYATTVVTDLALDWCARATEPWFAYVPYNAAHAPWHYPPEDLHTRRLSGDPDDDRPAFTRAALEACDTEIGRLVEGVRTAARGPVVVVLLGDNGTSEHAVLPPLLPERAKGTVYDAGTRIPLLVNGPGIPAGRQVHELVSATDILATVLEMAGVDVPPAVAEDSHSFLGLASGRSQAPIRKYVYAERFEPNGATGNKSELHRMLRDRQWKLIRHKLGADELYYLPNDPLEEHDLLAFPLATRAAEAYARLQQDLPAVQYH